MRNQLRCKRQTWRSREISWVLAPRSCLALLRVLRDEVIPLFYERDADGLPRQWIEYMVESIATLAPRFSAHRMVMDYVRQCYLVAAGGLSSDMTKQ
jgi:glucan phosphorylase